MKISLNWLRQYVEFDWSPDELADRLTMCGLEVEGIELFETIPGSLEGVVVGEVLSAVKHPDADRLRVCRVNVGESEPLAIVCGAPNVAAGQKVAVALVGTTLYPTGGEALVIKKSKIRGEVSEGMICALDELGIGEDHSGIVILDAHLEPGTPVAEVFHVETDHILEIGLTANRADAASHYGVARDIAALLKTKAIHPAPAQVSTQPAGHFSIELPEPERCPRYAGIYVTGVKVSPSPDWLQNRLRALGLRPINNVVDITNYVLHELGQPLHAFDADKVAGRKIVVKTLSTATKFTTLDDQERELLPGEDLMICDESGPVAIAGIMGGQNSEVSDSTTSVFLESAYFTPRGIRKTARRLGLKTDASFRFERGTDPAIPLRAAMRAAQLITELAGGHIAEVLDQGGLDSYKEAIVFDMGRANKLMGKEFTREELNQILNSLEIEVQDFVPELNTLMLHVPLYRVDVKRPQDVMEEILRIYGQNNVPRSHQMLSALLPEPPVQPFRLRQRYFDFLAANGWNEILTNPLVPAKHAGEHTVNLINNLSEDLAVMRTHMMLTGLDVIEFNHNRKNLDLNLVEFGKTYSAEEGKYREKEWIAWFVTGNKGPQHWKQKPEEATFFTLKREMERLMAWMGFEGKFKPIESSDDFDYGLVLEANTKVIATFGRVKAAHLKGRDIRGEVFMALADWAALVKLNAAGKVEFKELPKYPSVRRDISMIVPQQLSFAAIEQAIRQCNPKLVREVILFDVYKGDKIEAGKKSYAVGITLLDESKTLTDEAADALMKKVFAKLETENGVQIRK